MREQVGHKLACGGVFPLDEEGTPQLADVLIVAVYLPAQLVLALADFFKCTIIVCLVHRWQ